MNPIRKAARMEKLSEEMANELLKDVNGPDEAKERIKERWRFLGYLAPVETLYEKAWRLRKAHEEDYDKQGETEVFDACEDAVTALLAEIDRLKREAWTDEEVDDYRCYILGRTFYKSPQEWRIARYLAKAKGGGK
jgi:hypothetical protein